jgi:glycosyltransferase involved in cell wall biosynthesis
MMNISLVTVCYNSVKTIEETLRSVAEQEYPHVQHVVVDGASTDGTQDIVSRYLRSADIFISEPDSGIYNAMNKGLNLANGDIIAFINADDHYAHPKVLSNVMAVFAEQPAINAVFGDVAYHRADKPQNLYRRYDSGMFRPSRLGWGWMPAHPGMFVAASVFEAIGGFREDYEICADYEFVARAFARDAVKFTHLPEVLVHMLPEGVSTRDWRARMQINRESVRACLENGIYSNQLMILCKYPQKVIGYFG